MYRVPVTLEGLLSWPDSSLQILTTAVVKRVAELRGEIADQISDLT